MIISSRPAWATWQQTVGRKGGREEEMILNGRRKEVSKERKGGWS
jgi:hypothetical protein